MPDPVEQIDPEDSSDENALQNETAPSFEGAYLETKHPSCWSVCFPSTEAAEAAVVAFWDAVGSDMIQECVNHSDDKLNEWSDRGRDLRTTSASSIRIDGETRYSSTVQFKAIVGELREDAVAWLEAQGFKE